MTFEQVKKYFKSVLKAARALDVSPQAVYGWRDHGIDYPRQCQIEKVTGGKLKAEKAA